MRAMWERRSCLSERICAQYAFSMYRLRISISSALRLRCSCSFQTMLLSRAVATGAMAPVGVRNLGTLSSETLVYLSSTKDS
jgi:hypothetical protein